VSESHGNESNGNDGSERAYDAEGLALHLLRGTQAAAVACLSFVGKGDKNAADEATVKAMREVLGSVPGRGRVVIGEGEKDDAPMLYNDEEVGDGRGPAFELAIDPLEGTNYAAQGTEGAISVMAAAPRGALWSTSGFYVDKMVVGSRAKGAVDITASTEEKLTKVAEASGKPVDELIVVVLDKPRHEELIAEVRRMGAHVVAIPDGDVMGSLRVLMPGGGADLLLGVGGTPEGVITACAARVLDGGMQARLAPQDDEERSKIAADGVDVDKVLTLDDLVATDDGVFVATGVTSSTLLGGPERTLWGWRTHSLVVTPHHNTLFVDAYIGEE
jgi:fructose-1,6-bisphosphatase II